MRKKTIIQRMCSISDKMRNPEMMGQLLINEANSKKADSELGVLRKTLGMNTMQVLILIAILQKSSCCRIQGNDISSFLGMEYLQFLTLYDDMEDLRKRGYIRIDKDGMISIPSDVLKNLKSNKPIEPEPTVGLNTSQILNRMKKILSLRRDYEYSTKEAFDEIMALMKGNPETSISRACDKYILGIDYYETMVFFFLIDYYWFKQVDKVGLYNLVDLLDEDVLANLEIDYRFEIMLLQQRSVIEYAEEEGMLTKDYFRIKDAIKEEIFEDVGGIRKKETKISASRKMEAFTINRKELFYNPTEAHQVAQLKELLSERSFNGIRARMKDKGFRSAFTCLFYGSPGTGKTETVYQIARESGRDLYIVDVSRIKSCWVGESEKNIKNVFDKYRACVNSGSTVPILLFNEADAIFGIRQQGAERAVDKMENSIQNIILQEMENLDGILIATTNLTESLDKAFERRFLYKVRFDRPSQDVKCMIWKSMLPDITEENAAYLAGQFELSGGQIENIARKNTIQSILSGTEASIEDLIKYCSEEQIGANEERRRIGF